jgi:photosystem II stability/assembly factor-like uncharacterized protein
LFAGAGNGDGLIYHSVDAGLTWSPTRALSNAWWALASSADGTHAVATVGRLTASTANWVSGGIFSSQDSGATWTQTSAPTNDWTGVATSADGTRFVAVSAAYLGDIFVSTNAGATWTKLYRPVRSGRPWRLLRMVTAQSRPGQELTSPGPHRFLSPRLHLCSRSASRAGMRYFPGLFLLHRSRSNAARNWHPRIG